MKKNKMMRLASVLLVLVLLTTCAISGTFAKYVTADNGSDSARVAKWGVVASVEGSLFEDAYKDSPVTYEVNEEGDTITVQAAQATNLVAPGTKNEEGMTFVLTGTPEVDTKIEVAVTVNNDVVLKAGEYDNPTTGEAGDKFMLDADYYPVVFTLSNGDGEELAQGNLATIETYLEGLSKDRVDTNTDLATIGTNTDGIYKLTWAWAFGDTTGVTGNDKADTVLGNAAVNAIAGATTDIEFAISITVTQLD